MPFYTLTYLTFAVNNITSVKELIHYHNKIMLQIFNENTLKKQVKMLRGISWT